MNRQLMKVCLIALLILLIASFTPYSSAASRLKDESSKRFSHMADGLSMGIVNQFPKKFE